MAGAIVLIVIMLFVFPPILFASFGAVAVILGELLTRTGEETHEGSELIELNR